jgi:hypothetical protein
MPIERAGDLAFRVKRSWVVPQIALVLKIFAWDLCDASGTKIHEKHMDTQMIVFSRGSWILTRDYRLSIP